MLLLSATVLSGGANKASPSKEKDGGVLPSVSVGSMDVEHQHALELLADLAQNRSPRTLEKLLLDYTDHFAHEERLFAAHGWGESDDFSRQARKKHVGEHERLLFEVSAELARVQEVAQLGGSGEVSGSFIEKAVRDFVDHVRLFDMGYAGWMRERGAE